MLPFLYKKYKDALSKNQPVSRKDNMWDVFKWYHHDPLISNQHDEEIM